MGRKKSQPSLKIHQIEKALIKSNGLVTVAAKMLGVTHGAIGNRIKKSERLQRVQDSIVEKKLDMAENVVDEHMSKKSLVASFFYLKTKGKHRGWVEKQNVEVTGTVTIERIERIIIDPEPIIEVEYKEKKEEYITD